MITIPTNQKFEIPLELRHQEDLSGTLHDIQGNYSERNSNGGISQEEASAGRSLYSESTHLSGTYFSSRNNPSISTNASLLGFISTPSATSGSSTSSRSLFGDKKNRRGLTVNDTEQTSLRKRNVEGNHEKETTDFINGKTDTKSLLKNQVSKETDKRSGIEQKEWFVSRREGRERELEGRIDTNLPSDSVSASFSTSTPSSTNSSGDSSISKYSRQILEKQAHLDILFKKFLKLKKERHTSKYNTKAMLLDVHVWRK